jgi:sugar O-acyltransferase (sialic acid O-acetyltransferase NeuD family)
MSGALLLVGAGGLAREVLAAGITSVTGILDDDETRQGTEVGGVAVVGTIADAAHRPEALLVCIGDGASRRRVVSRLRALGVHDDRYETFAARSARIGTTSDVGAGSILLDGVVVTADARLGRHVVVMPHCTVTHDGVVEDFATLAAGVSLGGGVHIRKTAYIGMNASVRQGIVVGARATVGMGAVVLSDVPAGETWAGVPARRLEARA